MPTISIQIIREIPVIAEVRSPRLGLILSRELSVLKGLRSGPSNWKPDPTAMKVSDCKRRSRLLAYEQR